MGLPRAHAWVSVSTKRGGRSPWRRRPQVYRHLPGASSERVEPDCDSPRVRRVSGERDRGSELFYSPDFSCLLISKAFLYHVAFRYELFNDRASSNWTFTADG